MQERPEGTVISHERPRTRPRRRQARLRARPGARVPLVVGAGFARPVRDRGRQGRRGLGLRRNALPRLRPCSSTSTSGTSIPRWWMRSSARRIGSQPWAPAFGNLTRGEAAYAHPRAKAGGHFGKVFFTNGGADANENAIRMAAPDHWSGHGAVPLPLLPRQHSARRSCPRATGGASRTSTRAGTCTSSGRSAYRSEFWSDSPGAGVGARPAPPRAGHPVGGLVVDRGDPDRDRAGYRRHPGATARLPRRGSERSATSTASC